MRFIQASKPSKLGFTIISLALAFVCVLSFLSLIEFCVEHCSSNQDYRLFGIHFAWVGLVFFPALFIFHLLSLRVPLFILLTGWGIASALGAELMFIGIQYYQIGHWCPLCMSIAAALGIAGAVYITGFIKNIINNQGEIMNKIRQAFATFSIVILGFLIALIGVSKVNPAEAAAAEMKDKLAFGKVGSPIEVYFVTDWYCKACRRVDPLIEKIYPDLRKEAAIFFIDYPIHKNSTNYVPFNISFLVNNKPQYFNARNLLLDLASKNDAPTDKDVEAAVKKYNIQFRELPYLEVKNGMDYFEKIVDKFQLSSTPILIVTNTKTNKVIKLDGLTEITEERIKKALEDVKK